MTVMSESENNSFRTSFTIFVFFGVFFINIFFKLIYEKLHDSYILTEGFAVVDIIIQKHIHIITLTSLLPAIFASFFIYVFHSHSNLYEKFVYSIMGIFISFILTLFNIPLNIPVIVTYTLLIAGISMILVNRHSRILYIPSYTDNVNDNTYVNSCRLTHNRLSILVNQGTWIFITLGILSSSIIGIYFSNIVKHILELYPETYVIYQYQFLFVGLYTIYIILGAGASVPLYHYLRLVDLEKEIVEKLSET